jgi:hypothetical protein
VKVNDSHRSNERYDRLQRTSTNNVENIDETTSRRNVSIDFEWFLSMNLCMNLVKAMPIVAVRNAFHSSESIDLRRSRSTYVHWTCNSSNNVCRLYFRTMRSQLNIVDNKYSLVATRLRQQSMEFHQQLDEIRQRNLSNYRTFARPVPIDRVIAHVWQSVFIIVFLSVRSSQWWTIHVYRTDK